MRSMISIEERVGDRSLWVGMGSGDSSIRTMECRSADSVEVELVNDFVCSKEGVVGMS